MVDVRLFLFWSYKNYLFFFHKIVYTEDYTEQDRKDQHMKKIASFTIDHLKLQPGIYVSRKDTVGTEVITTFDLRMTSPNEEPVMNTAEMHTIY